MATENTDHPGQQGTTGKEAWRPARETRSQREWTPGKVKPRGSIRVMFCSALLGMEALVLFLYGVTVYNLNQDQAYAPWVFGGSVVLAIISLVAIGFFRRGKGFWIGWAVQILLTLGGFFEYTAFLVGLAFLAAWWWAYAQGGKMDRENAQRDEAQRQWELENPEEI